MARIVIRRVGVVGRVDAVMDRRGAIMFDWDDLRMFSSVARAGRVAGGARAVDATTITRRIARSFWLVTHGNMRRLARIDAVGRWVRECVEARV